MEDYVSSLGTTPKRPMHPQRYPPSYALELILKSISESAPNTKITDIYDLYMKLQLDKRVRKYGRIIKLVGNSATFEQHSPVIQIYFRKGGYVSVDPVTLHFYEEGPKRKKQNKGLESKL